MGLFLSWVSWVNIGWMLAVLLPQEHPYEKKVQWAVLEAAGASRAAAPAAPVAHRADVQVRPVIDVEIGAARLARDPVSGQLYYLLLNGDIYRLDFASSGAATKTLAYSSLDHGLTATSGFAFAHDGRLFLLGNTTQGSSTFATVRRGLPAANGGPARTWSTVARTAPYPRSNTTFDHNFNALVVSRDGRFLFVSSGSRTDHGEVQDNGGLYPGMREVPLTSAVFRLPADATDLFLPDDEAALKPYLYADGLRNSFDLAFAPNGDLFGAENSGERDDPEELNWIREGLHYGFPWRMGTNRTPQQDSPYDPEADLLVNPRSTGYRSGFFHDDPTYPAPPPGLVFTDPIPNRGPDADRFRDPNDGSIRDASDLGVALGTFTAHRSPLGLVFGNGAMSAEFEGDAFMLSWTTGDPAARNSLLMPFGDTGQDLLHLELTRTGESYEVRSTRLVSGFGRLIDAEVIGNRIYVLEYGVQEADAPRIWEVTMPPSGNPDAIGEAGFLSFSQKPGAWQTVALRRTYANPVVVAQPLSFNGNQPATLRVRNVTAGGFEVQIDEWDYLDGSHGNETVPYLVLEAGAHTLADGTLIQAGFLTAGDGPGSFEFPLAFASAPVVLSQVVTVNDARAVVTRQKNLSPSGLTLYLQGQEADPGHAPETVAYVALTPARGLTSGRPYEIGLTPDAVTHKWFTIGFTRAFSEAPVFVAAMQRADGADPAALRFRSLTPAGVQVRVEEERSMDNETSHTAESVGYALFEPGFIAVSPAAGSFAGAGQPAGGGKAMGPGRFLLEGNYPNPFNPRTVIRYELPEPTRVTLDVFDVMGRRVAVLVAARQEAGAYEVAFDGADLPSGLYFCRLQAGAFADTRKMLLLR